MKVDGQCHCGAIAYTAEVDANSIAICHCTDCQTLSGSAFRAGVSTPATFFKFLRGSPKNYVKAGTTGAKRKHGFCENCGAPIYSCVFDDPQTYTLRVGGLNQRLELGRPKRQIWTKRRLPWVPPLAEIPETEGQPAANNKGV